MHYKFLLLFVELNEMFQQINIHVYIEDALLHLET